MDPKLRRAFNTAGPDRLFRGYRQRLEQACGSEIPFRLAETPFFIPPALRDRLATAAREIVAEISDPGLIARLARAVPPALDVPRRDALASCIQVDFAIVRDAQGELDGRLVELQGFPSLYALSTVQTAAWAEQLRSAGGVLDRPGWTCFFGGLDTASFTERFRSAIVADCQPDEVILMDLDPPSQKTLPDFAVTHQMLGVDAVCPTTLTRDGRTLYRTKNGRRVAVRRIYNRVVFDELERKNLVLPFKYTDDLDVAWVPHPNWYWIWSKYTIPHLRHRTVPRTRFLSEISVLPDDLTNYVLKPLFSFAGTGVKVDVTRAEIDAIPDAERHGWLLQERITYAPDLEMPDGNGVKVEVRMMFLKGPRPDDRPELVLNLARLSRGKMHGVDHNKDLAWTGGTVGIWDAAE